MPEPTPINATVAVPWPAPPADVAYQGLAGQIVHELLPHTEADPVGLLVTLLACAGNALGPGPHYRVSGARHELRLFPILVGPTSSGRKGSSLDAIAPVLEAALPDWWALQRSGLVSGEGLIYHVRDEIRERKPRKDGDTILEFREQVTDPGIADKRLLIVESEFSSILKVMTRRENTLSDTIRNAWDGKKLSTLSKNAPVTATGAHITILGHITPEELLEELTATNAKNGFANRFMWVCVRRSKLLPFGGELEDDAILGMAETLRQAVRDAAPIRRITLSAGAKATFARVYEELSTGPQGLVGVLLGRATPYVMRIAGIYAALDASAVIEAPHLDAALALWGYAEVSVQHIFAPVKEEELPAVATAYRRTILERLALGGMAQTEISDGLFHGNVPAELLAKILDKLLTEGLVQRSFIRPASGRGRSMAYWELATAAAQEVAHD